MEAGLDFKEIGISPEDAQMLASREFGVEEMARYFRIPLHMVGSMKGSTYSNIEQQAREFIDYTMMPWFTNWESELNDKLFRENEKGQYFVKFNVNALLRGDQKSRMEFYAKGIQWGILNPNDVRRLEDMNPRDGGDDYLTPVNMFTGEQLDLMVEKLKGEINGN
jgi:HK97 family phage portal protein